MRLEAFKFWDLVRPILEILRYICGTRTVVPVMATRVIILHQSCRDVTTWQDTRIVALAMDVCFGLMLMMSLLSTRWLPCMLQSVCRCKPLRNAVFGPLHGTRQAPVLHRVALLQWCQVRGRKPYRGWHYYSGARLGGGRGKNLTGDGTFTMVPGKGEKTLLGMALLQWCQVRGRKRYRGWHYYNGAR